MERMTSSAMFLGSWRIESSTSSDSDALGAVGGEKEATLVDSKASRSVGSIFWGLALLDEDEELSLGSSLEDVGSSLDLGLDSLVVVLGALVLVDNYPEGARESTAKMHAMRAIKNESLGHTFFSSSLSRRLGS